MRNLRDIGNPYQQALEMSIGRTDTCTCKNFTLIYEYLFKRRKWLEQNIFTRFRLAPLPVRLLASLPFVVGVSPEENIPRIRNFRLRFQA